MPYLLPEATRAWPFSFTSHGNLRRGSSYWGELEKGLRVAGEFFAKLHSLGFNELVTFRPNLQMRLSQLNSRILVSIAALGFGASTRGAAPHASAEFHLGHRLQQLPLNSNGALVAWAGQLDPVKEAKPVAQSKAMQAKGPLRVHPTNPRYFTDGNSKAILLTGSHTWGNLQDYRYVTLPSPPSMDFDVYLVFLHRHRHNFFRLWAWEAAFNPNVKQGTTFYDPMPYKRPGPGNALDGKPKFDLTRFNPAYFGRLRARVLAARDSGVYVSVMLFNGFSIEGKGNDGGDPWVGHPFNPQNNINAIDGGSSRIYPQPGKSDGDRPTGSLCEESHRDGERPG